MRARETNPILLFCFGVVKHLEDIDLKCLPVLADVAQDHCLCLVELWV